MSAFVTFESFTFLSRPHTCRDFSTSYFYTTVPFISPDETSTFELDLTDQMRSGRPEEIDVRPDQMNGHSVWGLRFERTAKRNVMANGHELWWRTATNFDSERPRTLVANGHELWWRTAKNFGGERPRFLMANGHPYIFDFINISTTWIMNLTYLWKCTNLSTDYY